VAAVQREAAAEMAESLRVVPISITFQNRRPHGLHRIVPARAMPTQYFDRSVRGQYHKFACKRGRGHRSPDVSLRERSAAQGHSSSLVCRLERTAGFGIRAHSETIVLIFVSRGAPFSIVPSKPARSV
jgi:hypothetical protein